MRMYPEDWKTVRAEEVAANTPNALATGPFGSAISAKFFVDTGVPVIRGKNLSGDVGLRLSDDGLAFIPDALAEDFRRSEALPGDLVFTCWGTIGQVGIIDGRAAYDRYIVSNKQMKLTPDPEVADSLFLYYAFSSPRVMESVQGQAIGSSVPGFNLGQLRAVEIPLPPLPEQRRIAAVLGALDDKIELNRQMNRTLEEMAQAVFKSWFIDFDGHDPEDMVDSELGPIPRGWEVHTLGEMTESFDSIRVPLSKLERSIRKGPYPYYGASGIIDHLDDYLFDGEHLLVSEDGENLKSRKTPIAFVATGRFWVNNHAHVLLGRGGISVDHLDLFFRKLDLNPYLTGAVQPKLSQKNLKRIPLVVSPPTHLERFDDSICALFERKRNNDRESRTLTALRDTLLPKLISGEVRVPEAEDAVEAAL